MNIKPNLRRNKVLVIYGAGGHASVVYGGRPEIRSRNRVLTYDDDPEREEVLALGTMFIVAIGNNGDRERIHTHLERRGLVPINVLYTDATVVPRKHIARRGIFVGSNASIMVDCDVGAGTIINTHSSIDHHCKIGRFCHIAPGSVLCGRVSLGNRVLIGAGATLLPEIHVCDDAIVGAGATVTRPIVDPGTYVGTPARRQNT